MDAPSGTSSKKWENASGIWLGEITGNLPDGRRQVAWVLTLFADAPFPSAFGASVRYNASDDVTKSINDNDVQILQGTWDHSRQKLKLIELSTKDSTKREFEAVVYEQAAGTDVMVCIRGTWRSGTASGTIFCCFDPDGTNAAGLWLGQAVPDASLADFMIPTNPICWSLALLPSGAIFGAGYFDDSGDVPNKPLLFFALTGRWDCEKKTLQLTKRYELAAETSGWHVDYDAKLEGDLTGSECWMKGSWKNPQGGSFGQLSARRQPPAGSLAAICLCHVCGRALKPGELRYNCSACMPLWCCCSACESSSQRPPHPHPLAPEMVFRMQTARGSNCAAIALDAFTRFESRPFIGTRTPTAAAFSWHSYAQVHAHVLDLAYGLRELGCAPRTCALICADLSMGYLVGMLGLVVHQNIVVPVHGAMEAIGLEHVLRKTTPSVCLMAPEYRQKVLEAMKATSVSCPVVEVLDFVPVIESNLPQGDGWKRLSSSGVIRFGSLLSAGRRARGTNTSFEVAPVKRDEVSAVLFTSGSTGVPKGAIFNEDLMMPSEGVATVQPFIRLDFQAFDPSFVLSVLQTMHCGGQRLFTSGLASLMQDFELGRPTHIGATPALWNSLYQEFVTRVASDLSKSPAGTSRAEVEKHNASLLRRKLGNRLVVASSGGAPLAPEVLQFAKQHLQIDIVDLYGSRETGGITRDGVVYKALDVKLLSIPELGYTADAHPPRGEICVCSPRLIPGYYNDPEQTAKAFVEIDGKKYYRTGDIGELTGTDPKRLRVLDRCGALIKLSQGEWVSPARIEAVLEQCPSVQQALVLGSPSRPSLVAVIVPARRFEAFWASTDPEARARASTALLEELRFWCTHHRLRPIEIPQSIHLEADAWTPENGLLTSTEKKRRPLLTQRYAQVRDSLYAHLSSATHVPAAVPTGVSEQLVSLLRQVLPAGVHLAPHSTFVDLGGDSLAAARLSVLLSDAGVQVSVKDLYEYPLAHLSQLLDPKWRSSVPTSVRADRTEWASEWRLPADLQPVSKVADPVAHPHVFVTGATGFLGPVLVAEILSAFATDASVYCLVRASTPAVARDRLVADMKKALVWKDADADRIKVLCGDLAQPHLGLSDSDYQTVVSSISHIFHSGACVNMTLPYRALRAANVGGTVEVIRMATRAGAHLHYISTVAAIPADSSAEEDWLEPDLSKMELKDGYGQSKVVAEQLLNAARRQLGLDVRVVRPSAVCGDTRTGYSNQLDFGGLLLKACALVRGAVLETPAVMHWIPVDVVARVTVALARHPAAAGRVFHLTSSGPALRDILQAMQTVGCTIVNMPKQLWRSKLLALPQTEPTIYPLREMLGGFDWTAAPSAAVSTVKTREFLSKELGISLTNDCVTQDQVVKMLKYLHEQRFFENGV